MTQHDPEIDQVLMPYHVNALAPSLLLLDHNAPSTASNGACAVTLLCFASVHLSCIDSLHSGPSVNLAPTLHGPHGVSDRGGPLATAIVRIFIPATSLFQFNSLSRPGVPRFMDLDLTRSLETDGSHVGVSKMRQAKVSQDCAASLKARMYPGRATCHTPAIGVRRCLGASFPGRYKQMQSNVDPIFIPSASAAIPTLPSAPLSTWPTALFARFPSATESVSQSQPTS
ncbi:hypothetical protein BDV93DRAFT_555314 [Ceratobasidium sp. AG-I]|nr:hypothetical protein BDV93DRAFT_555314 [Ceratobasidium sp. AG-I]